MRFKITWICLAKVSLMYRRQSFSVNLTDPLMGILCNCKAKLAVKNLSRKRLLKYVDTQLMIYAIKSATGLPAVISR